jgi:hypothetical protein
MKNLKFNHAPADTIHSTFRHEIHVVGRPSPIIGYSKKQGCSEKQDKIQLLKDIAVRLMTNTNDYLNQSYVISFFKNDSTQKVKEQEVLALFPKTFALGGDYANNFDLAQFFEKIYKDLASGEKLTKDKYIKERASKDFDFNLHFDTEADLSAYCAKLNKQHGHAMGRCKGYYYKMIELGKVG